MKITSIFASDLNSDSAVCTISLNNNIALPTDLWCSSPNDSDFISAALKQGWNADTFLVNPVRNPIEADTPLAVSYLRNAGKSVKVSPAFRLSEGMAVLSLLVKKGGILPGSFPEWARLKRQTEQAGREIQSGPMAFLQAVIEVETRSRFSQDYLLGASVGDSGVQPAPNGVYVPVSSWANGTL